MSIACPNRIESFQSLPPCSGTSEDAHVWEKLESKIREDMSRAMSVDGQEIEQELSQLFQEHCMDNWDGYGAKPITHENFLAAINFLHILPTSVRRPEFSVDPDGAIVFEWYRRPRRVFSVAVEKNNRLTYAGLFDSSKESGTDYFDSDLSEVLFLHIQRVIS